MKNHNSKVYDSIIVVHVMAKIGELLESQDITGIKPSKSFTVHHLNSTHWKLSESGNVSC